MHFTGNESSSLSAKAKKSHRYKNNVFSKIESKHATDLRGVCLIYDNAGAYTYKLVKDFPGNRNCGTLIY